MEGKEIEIVHSDTAYVLNYNNENSLACVISIGYYSIKKDYIIYREFLTRKGFADLVFIPKKYQKSLLLLLNLNGTVQMKVQLSK